MVRNAACYALDDNTPTPQHPTPCSRRCRSVGKGVMCRNGSHGTCTSATRTLLCFTRTRPTAHLMVRKSHRSFLVKDFYLRSLNAVIQPFVGASLVTAIHTPTVPGVRESMAALKSQVSSDEGYVCKPLQKKHRYHLQVFRQRLVYDYTLRQLQASRALTLPGARHWQELRLFLHAARGVPVSRRGQPVLSSARTVFRRRARCALLENYEDPAENGPRLGIFVRRPIHASCRREEFSHCRNRVVATRLARATARRAKEPKAATPCTNRAPAS